MAVLATYKKLRSGAWGIRVPGNAYVGQVVTVAKRNGVKVIETVHGIIWSDWQFTLCAITPSRVTKHKPVVQKPIPIPETDPYWEDTYDPHEAFDHDGF